MESTISGLLKRYEHGTLTRRDLVAGLAALVASAGSSAAAQSAPTLKGTRIDHVSIQVSDLQRSKDFYTKAFGLKVRMEEANLIQLGSDTHGFLVIRKDTPAAKVDHFAISVDGMTRELVTQALKAHGMAPKDDKGAMGFHATDPDGYSIQYAR
jgi:catechol 2,3-dioxygenase-like lactoylglutathione lyase family enzyme